MSLLTKAIHEREYRNLYISVLVCLCCYNKIPQTGWFKQQTFIFSQFWSWKSKMRVPAKLVSGKSFLPSCIWLPSPCVLPRPCSEHKWGKRALWCPCLFLWPLNMNYLFTALSPNMVALAIRALTYIFWGDTIQSITLSLNKRKIWKSPHLGSHSPDRKHCS